MRGITDRDMSAFLEPLIVPRGFAVQEPLAFSRTRNGINQSIGFGCVDRGHGWSLGCSAIMEFPDIARVLCPVVDPDLVPGINMPMHLLHPGREYFDWPFSDKVGLTRLAQTVAHELDHFIVPFLDEHSSLDVVYATLERPEPMGWYTLGPEDRAVVLAAIDAIRGARARALERVEQAQAARRDELAHRPAHLRDSFLLEKARLALRGGA